MDARGAERRERVRAVRALLPRAGERAVRGARLAERDDTLGIRRGRCEFLLNATGRDRKMVQRFVAKGVARRGRERSDHVSGHLVVPFF